ncbi:MAG: IS1634 family transposase [Candidatus Peregrinibacteria bacterium]
MHIQSFKKGKRTYYRLVKSGRVNGQPRIIWQKYLGTAEKVKEVFEGKGTLLPSKVFGSVAAMLSIAEELQFEESISATVPDANYKLKIWQHIVMQSICRFHEPASKNKSIEWYDESILPLLWGKNFASPQTILNQFDKIVTATEDHTPQIEEDICKTLLKNGIRPSVLIWDPTNFFTYIEEGEELPKKGGSKEKRFDKNLINLGLVVSDENIPLMHMTYAGNERETGVVTKVVDTLFERFKKLGQDVDELVFVFDRGNNSKENIPYIGDKFHFIGALRKNQLKHLFDVNLAQFEDLYANKKGNLIKGYRTSEKVYGENYAVVVAYNEATARKQKAKTEESVEKIKKKFGKLEEGINNKKRGKNSTVKGVSIQVNDFLHKQYRSLFSWNLDEKNQRFSWHLVEAKYLERAKTYGKNILFTDLHEWATLDIAKTYNSKTILEDDFKVLKNRWLISVKPFFHQKDSHLRVHIFICVLSIMLYRYMLWKLKDLKMSEQTIVGELRGMRLGFVKRKDSSAVDKVLENMTPGQIKLYNALGLEKYLPV